MKARILSPESIIIEGYEQGQDPNIWHKKEVEKILSLFLSAEEIKTFEDECDIGNERMGLNPQGAKIEQETLQDFYELLALFNEKNIPVNGNLVLRLYGILNSTFSVDVEKQEFCIFFQNLKLLEHPRVQRIFKKLSGLGTYIDETLNPLLEAVVKGQNPQALIAETGRRLKKARN